MVEALLKTKAEIGKAEKKPEVGGQRSKMEAGRK
jgi:hypothetical protein